jgi:serine/threonine-protein kinase HipA
MIDGKAVLIIDRFDRHGDQRIGYASAMTMLEATDGDTATYLDIAETIEREGVDVGTDLRELWRRIGFSILISNSDDHIRNHGFLRLSTAGWTLSPAFDLNPDPRPGPKRLSTAIESGAPDTIETLLGVSPYFGLNRNETQAILLELTAATSKWRTVASSYGLDRAAIDRMATAFEHEQAATTRVIGQATT